MTIGSQGATLVTALRQIEQAAIELGLKDISVVTIDRDAVLKIKEALRAADPPEITDYIGQTVFRDDGPWDYNEIRFGERVVIGFGRDDDEDNRPKSDVAA